MKKLLYCAAALATLLFAGSCQRENLEPAVEGTTVTYTVSVPGVMATKASSYTGVVDSLVYEVHGANGRLYKNNAKFTNGVATLDIEVVKDQNFTILFWAQKSGVAFDTESLEAVKMPTTLTANVEDYEAFYGVDEFTYTTDISATNTVELTRAVSMLNIGTTTESLNVGGESGNVVLVKSAVSLGLPNTLNVKTGDATTDTPATPAAYAENGVPSGTLTVGTGSYVYVAKNYVGFADANKSTVDVTLTILTDEGTITHEIPSVPFQRNYKTNIVGDLITASASYQVELTDDWNATTLDVVLVKDASGLQEAINEAPVGQETEIKLGGDIDLNDLLGMIGMMSTKATPASAGIIIPTERTIVLNLNGCTISQHLACEGSYSMIQNNGNLTVTGGGSLIFKNDSEGNGSTWGTYTITNNGTLTVDNVTVSHLGSEGDVATNRPTDIAIQNYAGKVIVNSGLISSQYFRSLRDFTAGGEIVINGGTFNGQVWMQGLGNGSSSLTINGGEFAPISGYDSSSLYITNSTNVVNVAINGGVFSTKIGAAEPTKEGVVGCISGGKFTTTAKDNTNKDLFNDDYSLIEVDGYWTLEAKEPVAKIGEMTYTSLQKAVAAVEDGGTITLVKNEMFTENNRFNNGGWWDGLGYSGDKSFTIDLNGKTISQDGSLNDYLMWVKNDGAKANTITLKNGTMDAGTTAYSAFATASSNKQTITVNLENINLINNISNGAVVKARGGSVLNVKAGTVITGKNSYVGIEAVGNNTVVNVYEGAKIYQNGTSSYVGAIIGASYNATLNIYGGEGKSAKCGIIVMSTGATINVSGGEWTANGDGTVSNDNAGVLVSQNNRYESGWACKSVLNVTGGTFKGGFNCYGMGPGVEADDAQINISGGNFNADPTTYLEDACEATENAGVWTVRVLPAAKIGETEYASLQEAFNVGGNITLVRDVTVSETVTLDGGKTAVLDLNGKTLTANLVSALASTEDANLTVKNGKVVAYESTVRAIGGKVTVESGEYTSTGTALDSPATYRYSLDCREGGELIINGGTFKSNNGMINVGSTVTINGGKFENIVEKTMTRHFAYVSALLTINDGEFFGKANGSAGGCFFCGAAAGCDIQVNGGKFTSLWTSGAVNRIFEVYYGGTINVTGGMFNTNGGITSFVTANTDDATKVDYPYVAK